MTILMRIVATHARLGADLARADVEVLPGLALFGVRILRANDGDYRAFAQGASFNRDMVKSIATLIMGECQRVNAS